MAGYEVWKIRAQGFREEELRARTAESWNPRGGTEGCRGQRELLEDCLEGVFLDAPPHVWDSMTVYPNVRDLGDCWSLLRALDSWSSPCTHQPLSSPRMTGESTGDSPKPSSSG